MREGEIEGHKGYPNGPGGKSMQYSDQESRGKDVRPNAWQGYANANGKEKTIIHTDPNCPCYMLDAQSGERQGWAGQYHNAFNPYGGNALLESKTERNGYHKGFNDTGGASRFFYIAKASPKERGKNNAHPTVKPVALMEYLVKMVSREGAVVLDPFAGSMTTLLACVATGRKCITIEQSEEYCEMIKNRFRQIKMI